MSLADWAAVSTIASSIAVVVSLLLLYVQLQKIDKQIIESHKNQRAIINQTAMQVGSEQIQFLADPHRAALLGRAVVGDMDFSTADQIQLALILRLNLIALQDMHFQLDQGLIDSVTVASLSRATERVLTMPIFRTIWQRERGLYSSTVAAYVDQFIEDHPIGASAAADSQAAK